MNNFQFPITEYSDSLSSFLEKINFRMPAKGHNLSLEQPVLDHFNSQLWSLDMHIKAIQVAQSMYSVGMFYPYASKDIQIRYGIYSTYVVIIDDFIRDFGDAVDEFEKNLIGRKKQGHPVLESFVQFLMDNSKHIGRYSCSVITKATIDFICGSIIERDCDGIVRPPVGALKFPDYLRRKTGLAEVYSVFGFPQNQFPEEACLYKYLPAIPDLIVFFDHINDILSFYKESGIESERFNYIYNYAFVNNITPIQALQLVLIQIEQSITNIRTVFQNEPQLLDSAEQLFRGYIAWHLTLKRYHLDDLSILDKCGNKYCFADESSPNPPSLGSPASSSRATASPD